MLSVQRRTNKANLVIAGVSSASHSDTFATSHELPQCKCAHVHYTGQPEFAVDVDNIKPTGLVVAAAVAMLLLGKPLSGSRGFGGLQFGLPRIGDCTAKVRMLAPGWHPLGIRFGACSLARLHQDIFHCFCNPLAADYQGSLSWSDCILG